MTQDIRPRPYPHGQPFMNSSCSNSSILSSAVSNSNSSSSSILSSADRNDMSAVRFHNAKNQQQRRRLLQSASCSPFNSSRVSFGTISILEFPTIIGDNPVVHDGCPIALGPYPILPSSSAVSVNNNNSTSIMTSKKNRNRNRNRNSNSSTPPIGGSSSCSSASSSSSSSSSSTSSMEDDQETSAGEFAVRRPAHQQHHCVTIMTVQKYEWHRAYHHVSSASTTAAAAAAAGFNNNRDPLRLSSDQRHQRLLEVGYTSQDIFKATNTASKSKRVRDRSNQQVPFDHMHLLVERTVRRVCKLSTIFRRSKNRRKLKQQQQTQVAHTTW